MFWNKKSKYEELYDKIDKLQKELKYTQDSILKIVNIMKNYDFNKKITYESCGDAYISYTSIFINLKCYKFCNLRLYNPVFREHEDNKSLLTIFDLYKGVDTLYTYEYLVDLNQGTFITVSEKKIFKEKEE